METLNFESVKIAMKQDKEGYVLTLRVHPDEVPDALFRDFVGARYQTVMVRLGDNDKPMNREDALSRDLIRLAGIICREQSFADWLFIQDLIPEPSEQNAVEWLRAELDIQSRSELKENAKARGRFIQINEDYQQWKQQNA
jgi:hypothetical protein